MSAPTIEPGLETQPLLSVFAVRAELEPFADIRHFDAEIDAAIEHAASTGDFDRLREALITNLGFALMAKNAGTHARLPILQRGENLKRMIREWVAEHPEACHS